MKATLYNEEEQPIEALNVEQQALASEKPEPVDVPKQGLYVVNYKTLVKPTLIALAIFLVWILATVLL